MFCICFAGALLVLRGLVVFHVVRLNAMKQGDEEVTITQLERQGQMAFIGDAFSS